MPERLVRPPATTLFHQVLAHLEAKPDPPKCPSGSTVGREGVAAAAVTLRWGSYLVVLLARSGGQLDGEAVAEALVQVPERLEDEMVEREPDRSPPVGVAAEDSAGRFGRLVIDACYAPDDPVFERFDAFYLPLARFEGFTRPGPRIEIRTTGE